MRLGAAFQPFCSPASGLQGRKKRDSQNETTLFTGGGGPNLPRENIVFDRLYVWIKTCYFVSYYNYKDERLFLLVEQARDDSRK